MKRGTRFVSASVVGFGLACGLGGPGPESVAESWLRLGSESKLEEVKTLVDPDCLDHKPTVNVAPSHVLGARITIDDLQLELVEQTDERATVHYALKGHIEGGDKTMKIGKVEFKADVSVDNIDTNGDIALRKVGSEWKVTCR